MSETWSAAVDDWGSWFAAGGGAPLSRRLYANRLQLLARHVGSGDPWSTTYEDLIGFLASRPGWSPETRNTARVALRSFFGWASKTGRMPANPALELPSIKRPQGQPRPAPMAVVEAALDAAPQRTRWMVLLAVTAGLRRGEIARVHRRDLVEGVLRVSGKGGKVRLIPLHNRELVAAIEAADGYLFPGAIDGHLSPDRVGHVLADVLGAGWTGHTLRHRFATASYAAQRDLLAVQQLLGHAKPETSARYAAIPLDALDAAVAAAAAPWASSDATTTEAPPCPVVPIRRSARRPARRELPAVNREAFRAAVDAAPGPVQVALWLYASGLTGRQLSKLQWCDVDLAARCVLTSKGAVRLPAGAVDAMRAADGTVWGVLPGSYRYAVSRSASFVISAVGEAHYNFNDWTSVGGAISEWCRQWLADMNTGVTRITDLPALLA